MNKMNMFNSFKSFNRKVSVTAPKWLWCFVIALLLLLLMSIASISKNIGVEDGTRTTAAKFNEKLEQLKVENKEKSKKELLSMIDRTAREYGLDPEVMKGIAWVETRFNSKLIGDNGESFGLFQIQPKWHKKRMDKLGITDLMNPQSNTIVACNYMRELLNRYGNYKEAIIAYNAGHASHISTYYNSVTQYKTKI